MLQSEGRTSTVTQQTFEPRPVGALDTHRAIYRKVAVVRPGAHLAGVIFVDQAAPDKGGEDTGSHARLHVGKRRRAEFVGKGGMKADARRVIRGDGRLGEAVDDAAMEVDVLIQDGAESVDESDCPDPCGDGAGRAMLLTCDQLSGVPALRSVLAARPSTSS